MDCFLNFITEYYRVKHSKGFFELKNWSILLLISLILLLGDPRERLMRMGNFGETIFWYHFDEELKFVRILGEWGLRRPHWKVYLKGWTGWIIDIYFSRIVRTWLDIKWFQGALYKLTFFFNLFKFIMLMVLVKKMFCSIRVWFSMMLISKQAPTSWELP